MSKEEGKPHGDAENPSEETHGSEEETSGPVPSGEERPGDEELTVEDILNAAPGEESTEEVASAEQENPYLDDLRRLTAEYANYRKRTEDNREVEAQRAKARVIEPLLAVLDDLDRAEKHGDLVEGSAFLTISQKIRASLEKQGLEGFGEVGEPFDPQHHEAIAQVPVPGTEEQTVLDVIERGYRIGDVEMRPARVAVAVNPDG